MRPLSEDRTPDDIPMQADRDSSVMRVIREEALQGFTFEGLKRKLGTHSETLSRILTRLEEQGVLSRTEHGYEVTERGKDLAGARLLDAHKPGIVLLRTLLPPFQNESLISGLTGRWFGPLRWLGYSRDEGRTTLKWITEGGGMQVEAVFSEGELVIEGRIGAGSGLSDAIAASHHLVGYISRMYGQTGHRLAYPGPDNSGSYEN